MDHLTQIPQLMNKISLKSLHYHLVTLEHRGLTKQRNYGVRKVSDVGQNACFFR
jgi:repressor of nif and glnA expression